MSYEKYNESLERTGCPVFPHELDPRYDIRAMLRYAKEQGKTVLELTPGEKEPFKLGPRRNAPDDENPPR